jgi:hypothetical protein
MVSPTSQKEVMSQSDSHSGIMPRKLSQKDKVEIFRLATRSLVHWYGDKFKTGMSDDELGSALKHSLGIFGGSGGPDQLSISFKGSGLQIWGGWHTVNHVQEIPLYSGKTTIAMAREIYDIANPDDEQMSLL